MPKHIVIVLVLLWSALSKNWSGCLTKLILFVTKWATIIYDNFIFKIISDIEIFKCLI